MAASAAAATANLQSLAASTDAQLRAIWDELGTNSDERERVLSALSAALAQVYTSAVAEQEARRVATCGEIETLRETIINMQHAMEETPTVPEQQGPLISYRDTLEQTRASLQEMWDERERRLQQLQAQLDTLHQELVEEVPSHLRSIGTKMSLSRIGAYSGAIAACTCVKAERQAEIAALCDEMLELWSDMSFSPADEFETHVPQHGAGLGWGASVIATLKERLAVLHTEREERERRIDAMGKELTALWRRLQTPEEEQTSFLEAHMGLGDDVLTAVELYLAQKRKDFSAKLVDLIGAARATIDGLWTEMRAGPVQRAQMFALYATPAAEFNEQIYEAHEAYIIQLGKVVDELKPILKGIEKREELKADKAEYESIIADPSRLLARGSSAACMSVKHDPCRRLREEKLERRVKKELPAVTKRLRQQIVEWEAAAQRPFLVNDEPYVEVLDGEEAAETRAREDARAAREAKKAGDAANPLAASAGPSVIADTMKSATAIPTAPRSTSAGRASMYVKAPAAGSVAAATASTAASRRTTTLVRKGSVAASGSLASEAPAAAVDAAAPASQTAAPPAAPALAAKDTNVGRGIASKANSAAIDSKQIPPPSVPSEPAAPIATVAAVTVSVAAKESAARMLQML